MRRRRPAARGGLLALVTLLAALVFLSCWDDAIGPATLPGRFALSPHFASPHAGIVSIDRFRLILRRLSNDSIALDTVVAIAPGDTAVDLSFTVAMLTSTERFVLLMRLISPRGDTAFRAGPDTVAPSTGSGEPPSLAVDLVYVGTGADAAGVRFLSAAPTVFFGNTIEVAAEAFDSANNPIPETPIAYGSLDSGRARVPDARIGSVVAGTERGLARIVATLLTGPADTIPLLVQPVPSGIAIVSGSNQSGEPLTALSQPVVVQVNGADGLGIQGVLLRFSSPQVGTFAPESAFTDAQGQAATVWTLGEVAGAQTLSVTVDGFPTVQGTASAEAVPVVATTITLVSGDAQTDTVAATLRQVLVVKVTDRRGDPFAGTPVTFAVTAGGGTVGSTVATSDAAGLAQTTWTLGTGAGTQTVTATATGLAGSPITFTATATAATAVKLAYGVPPAQAFPGVAIAPAVEVRTEDQFGNLVTTATNMVTVALADNPASGTLTGTLTVAAAGGVAKFAQLFLDNIGTGYTLQATAAGLAPVTSAPFEVMPPPQRVAWISSTSGNWSDGTKWSTGRQPRNVDSVIIGQSGTYTVTLDVDTTGEHVVLGGASGTQTLAIGFRRLTITGQSMTIGPNGVLELSGGTLNGDGVVSVQGTLRWTGGTMGGTGTTRIETGGSLVLDGAGTKYLQARTILNAGTITKAATGTGWLYLWDGPVISISAGGLFDIQTATGIYHYSGTVATINNAGTFRKSAGSGLSYVDANLNNTGAVQAQVDTLQFTRDVSGSGTYTIAAGARLDFGGGGTRSIGTSVTGAGHLTHTGFGTTTITGSYNVDRTTVFSGTLDFSGPDTARSRVLAVRSSGTQGGTGIVKVADSLIWTSGSLTTAGGKTYIPLGAVLLVDSGGTKFLRARTLVNDGTLKFPAPTGTGWLYLWDGPVIDNRAGALFDIQTAADMYLYSGAIATINNAGTFRKSAGSGLSYVDAHLTNTGTVEAQADTLQFARDVSGSGTYTIAAGARLDFGGSGTRTIGSSVTGAGDFSSSGGTTTITGTYNITGRTSVFFGTLDFSAAAPDTAKTRVLAVSNGTQGGTGILAVTDSMIWTGGTLGTAAGKTHIRPLAVGLLDGAGAKFLQARTLVNAGTVKFPTPTGTGVLYLWDAPVIDNRAGGLIDIQTAGDIALYSGLVGTLNNAGTVRKSAGTGLSSVGAHLNNTGAVEVQADTLQFLYNGSGSGSYTISAGTRLDFGGSGTRTIGSSVTGAGDFSSTGGTTTITGTYNITGRTSAFFGTLNFSAAAPDTAKTRVLAVSNGTQGGTGILAVSDSMIWTGGTLTTSGGETYIRPLAVLLLDGPGAKFLQARRLANAGTVKFPATTGTGILYLWDAPVIDNLAGGLIDIQTAGDIAFYSGAVGTLNNAGTFRKSAGTGLSSVGAHLTNTGAVEVQADTLQFLYNGSGSGSYTISAGARLDFGGSGTRTVGSSVTGAGDFSSTGGTTTITGTYNITGRTSAFFGTLNFSAAAPDTAKTRVLAVSNGTQGGTGILAVSDSMIWTGGTLTTSGGETYIRPLAVLLLDGPGAKFLQARRLANAGTVKFPATTGTGILYLWDAPVIDNLAGAFWDIQTDADVFHYSGLAGTFNNAGTFRKSAGTGLSQVGDQFHNTGTGTVDVQTGTLEFIGTSAGASTFSAPVSVAGPATLDFSSNNFTLSSGFVASGAGHVNVSGATVTTADSMVFRHLAFASGTLSGTGVYHVTDSLVWTTGTMTTAGGRTRIPATGVLLLDGPSPKYLQARTLYNAGTVKFPATTGTGALYLWDAAVINNLSGAFFELHTDADIYHYSGAASTFNNTGTFRKSAGTGLSQVGDRFHNTGTGTVDVKTGTLDFLGTADGASTFSAPVTVASLAALDFSSNNFTLSGGFAASGAGHVSISGAIVTTGDSLNFQRLLLSNGTLGPTGVAAAAVVVVTDSLGWTGGNMGNGSSTGRIRIKSTGKLVLDGSGPKYLDSLNLVNEGIMVFPATGTGSLNLVSGPIIDNLSGAVIDIQNDADIAFWAGPALTHINNAGTLRKSGGTGITLIADTVSNSGTIDVQSGTFEFTNGGKLINTPTGVLTGTGTLRMSGDFSNAGTINPGTSPGILTFAGTASPLLPQQSSSVINIEVGGLTPGLHDQIVVTGSASLAGTLNVTPFAFTPTAGQTFTVITCSVSCSGSFSSLTSGWAQSIVGGNSVVLTKQ